MFCLLKPNMFKEVISSQQIVVLLTQAEKENKQILLIITDVTLF